MGEDKEKVISAEEVVDEKAPKKEKPKKKKKDEEKKDQTLLEIQDELAEIKDKYLRNLAEMENYKKRMNEDLMRARKYAGFDLASKLIDSIEIFNQALNMETNDPNLKNFLYGFRMIDDMIFNALKEAGVSVIETKVGDAFDPTKQEAMDKAYEADKPEHTVLKVVKKGYLFKDRILRPSMVVINIKPDEDIASNEKEETKTNIEEDNQERKDD